MTGLLQGCASLFFDQTVDCECCVDDVDLDAAGDLGGVLTADAGSLLPKNIPFVSGTGSPSCSSLSRRMRRPGYDPSPTLTRPTARLVVSKRMTICSWQWLIFDIMWLGRSVYLTVQRIHTKTSNFSLSSWCLSFISRHFALPKF